MKRWQDRGEVQDSEDDEDLALSLSPSPERPHKRVKHDQSLDTTADDAKLSQLADAHHDFDDEDEIAWLPAQVANPYGRKCKLIRPTKRTQFPPVESLKGNRRPESSQISRSGAEALSVEVESSLTSQRRLSAKVPSAICRPRNTPAATIGGNGTAMDVLEGPPGRDRAASELPTSTPVQFASQGTTSHAGQLSEDESPTTPSMSEDLTTMNLPSTPASDGEDLPDVRDLFTSARRGMSSTAASSPLSERDVSPPAYFETQFDRKAHSEASTIAEQPDSGDDIHDQILRRSIIGEESLLGPSTARRSLRIRKDIQLHPYLIDKAKYQRQCKERGIKPVRLVDVEPEHPGSPNDDDSSQQSAAELPSSNPQASADLLRGRPQAYVRLSSPSGIPMNDREGFGIQRVAKRRRIDGKRDSGWRREITNATTAGPGLQNSGLSVPPSPPQTLSQTSTPSISKQPMIQTASGFRRPRGLSPGPPRAPQVSSNIQPTDVDSESSSASGAKPRGQPVRVYPDTSIDSHDDGEEHSASSEPEAKSDSGFIAHRLQREQKRIRGVLPASWLRIDFQAQSAPKSPVPKAKRRDSTASPQKHTPQRGIAKRVNTTRKGGFGAHDMALALGDDSASDDSAQYLGTGACLTSDTVNDTVDPGDSMDIDNHMEHDFVDAMLPGSCHASRTTKPRSRQPRKSAGRSDAAFEERKARPPSSIDQRVSRDRDGRSAQRHRHTVPKLSIIDAYHSPTESKPAVPSFVRLALRQARRLPDGGRHSPSHKVIQLHTADETREATKVLQSWRAGTLLRRRKPIEQMSARLYQHAEVEVAEEGRSTTSRPRPLREAASNYEQDYGHKNATETLATREVEMASSMVSRPLLRHSLLGENWDCDATRTLLENPNNSRPRRIRERPQPSGVRAAQLETLQRDFDQGHRTAAFERRMQCLTETIALCGHQSRPSDLQLSRYVQQTSLEAVNNSMAQAEQFVTTAGEHQRVLTHRPRKRQARRLDSGALQHWQVNEIELDSVNDETDLQSLTDISKPVLLGLGGFGTQYPIDFDTKRMPQGSYFAQDSLVGSGDLHDAVNLASCNLDSRRGQISVRISSDIVLWEAWNEDVAADFRRIPSVITTVCQSLQQQSPINQDLCFAESGRQDVICLLKSVVRYCSQCLFFVDPMDRQACVVGLSRLVVELAEVLDERQAAAGLDADTTSIVMQYQLVLACQAIQLSTHPSVSTVLRLELENLLLKLAASLGRHALPSSLSALRDWYREVQKGTATKRTDCSVAAMTIVTLNHTARVHGSLNILWSAIHASLAADITTMRSVEEFERAWHGLFSILPALQINARGCIQDDHRPSQIRFEEDWVMVRALMDRAFELYQNTSRVRGCTVDSYMRVLLHRCHRLINIWQWTRCESILYTVYDFFSKQSRMLLENEESLGSFKILEDLSAQPSLEILSNDLSFHIFLKTLATALIRMREQHVYDDRRIGAGITYRMIPTHGRTYPKERDMQQEDMDSLRNHHDLLCTLYYASPSGYRPGVDILRKLVDHAKWHRKACQLNVKAWAMLTIFQSSLHESIGELQPLMAWFCDILKSSTTQYRLARLEAEHDFHHARGVGIDINESFVHATIANNQIQIASTLVDALAGLKRAFAVTTSIAGVGALILPICFSSVFELYDPTQRRLLGAASEALLAVQAALDAELRLRRHAEVQMNSNDSQEYGDFSALNELDAPEIGYSPLAVTAANSLLSPVSSFLSNIFGADTMPDDKILESSVRVWVRMALDLVNNHQRTWLSYVDEYSPNSWLQMRDTRQKRMFTPFYMSCIVEQPKIDEQVQQKILSSWLISLVEREAMLRFQHMLTSTLLNHLEAEPLLRNLPFATGLRSEKFRISLHDLRQRRLSMISSVFSNMREQLAELKHVSPARFSDVKGMYAEMLRQLMQTMKSNYQELQSDQSAEVADVNVQGAYVEFVQHVISFLQQHTADFCQIDKFFTDSSAFPLPATDPTYVVGKLKGYALKLADFGPRTELAVFIQAVSERAAVDKQQQYLVNQLATAMCGDKEHGRFTGPTLRQVLLTTILPAYIDNALDSACGWVLSLPLMRACAVVLDDVFYGFQAGDEASTIVTVATLTSVLHSINGQFDKALARLTLARTPASLQLLAAMFNICRASLSSSSCTQRHSLHGSELSKCLRALYIQSGELAEHVHNFMVARTLGSTLVSVARACPWPDTRLFADKQVRDSMNHWYIEDGRYYVRRGNLSKEVEVQLGSAEQERRNLDRDIIRFRMAYEATFEPKRRQRRKCSHMSDLMI